MAVTVLVPGSFARYLDGVDEVACEGGTVGQCLEDLVRRHPGFQGRVFDEKGQVSRVLIFVNGDNCMAGEGLATKVSGDDEIGIIPLAAGG